MMICLPQVLFEELPDCHDYDPYAPQLKCEVLRGHKNGSIISARYAFLLQDLFYPQVRSNVGLHAVLRTQHICPDNAESVRQMSHIQNVKSVWRSNFGLHAVLRTQHICPVLTMLSLSDKCHTYKT